MSLRSEVQKYLENLPKKLYWLDLPWNLSSLLYTKKRKKHNVFVDYWKIFQCGRDQYWLYELTAIVSRL